MPETDWNPALYEQFADDRLQPALDLLNAVGPLPGGPVVDLGCGSGTVGGALKARFPERRLVGVDNSAAMLGKARTTGWFDDLEPADIANWRPDRPVALIFSNAALQWLGDHAGLLHHLTGNCLAPGGTLAVQMPHQNDAPSHRAWRDAFADLFPGRAVARGPVVHAPAWYHHALTQTGKVRVWETEYFQTLHATGQGHPVCQFTRATYGKPFLDACTPPERARLIAAYEGIVEQAYPRDSAGAVLFPFRRLFFIYRS